MTNAATRQLSTTLVLVPGAWLGSWCWRPVVTLLRASGMTVATVAVPGLDDGRAATFDSHVRAVHAVLDGCAGPVALVGHSYGGAVITAAAAHSPEACLIFLDGARPKREQSTADTWSPDLRAELTARVDNQGMLPPPAATTLQKLSLDDRGRLRPHPWETLMHPVWHGVDDLTAKVAFVRSSARSSDYERSRLEVAEAGGYTTAIEGGHYAMLTNAAATAAALRRATRSLEEAS